MTEQQFHIPKINVPILCHTDQGEKLPGEIFLDLGTSAGYTVNQVLEYFNSDTPFFPLRGKDGSTILLRKSSVIQVELPEMLDQYMEQTSSFSTKKEGVFYMQTIGPVRVQIILDLPEEYSRFLDLVNVASRAFFPAIVNDAFALLSLRHIYKVEEIGHGET